MNTIQFFIRNNYGNTQAYPAGRLAPAITTLTGRKTLSKSDFKALQALGFEIQQINDPDAKAFVTMGRAA